MQISLPFQHVNLFICNYVKMDVMNKFLKYIISNHLSALYYVYHNMFFF